MSRILANTPDTQAPDSDYLKGKILDQDNTANPPIPGTPIVERLYGDIVEFFQKLMTMAGITENDLPDNETNGHQYIDALDDFVTDQLPSLAGKADKVVPATTGNFAALDGNGNLADSETGPNDMSNSGPVLWDADPSKFYSVAPNGAFNTAFGTGAGDTCQGNDSRLADSRQCNNSFDNAATARSNMGLGNAAVQTVGTQTGEVLTAGSNLPLDRFMVTSDQYETAETLSDADVKARIIGVNMNTKIIDIGDWNMDANSYVQVNHGVTTGISKIMGIKANIIKDDSSVVADLATADLGATSNASIVWNDTQITLERATGGVFDSADFDATSFNRGKIIIWYLP